MDLPNTLCILAPKDDHDMPWIVNLATAFQDLGKTVSYLDSASLSWEPHGTLDFSMLVNRSRDSTTGHQAKTVTAFLKFIEARGTKVFNGSHAYSIGNSKVNQLTVLHSLGLNAPRSLIVTNINQLLPSAKKLGFPLLIKPEEGGMGKGIIKFSSEEELQSYIDLPETRAKHEGTLWMLQEFVSALGDVIYRVWVCGGKVQCAIETSTTKDLSDGNCFNTCVCTLQKRPTIVIKAAAVTPEMESEAVRIMEYCQAHAGSVEFFINQDGKRVYFDINMLSTLPDPTKALNQGVWPDDYNPWKEFALRTIS
jgi:glutathione synthase/RimK-type ligase-like ATP-grasp enzyme